MNRIGQNCIEHYAKKSTDAHITLPPSPKNSQNSTTNSKFADTNFESTKLELDCIQTQLLLKWFTHHTCCILKHEQGPILCPQRFNTVGCMSGRTANLSKCCSENKTVFYTNATINCKWLLPLKQSRFNIHRAVSVWTAVNKWDYFCHADIHSVSVHIWASEFISTTELYNKIV